MHKCGQCIITISEKSKTAKKVFLLILKFQHSNGFCSQVKVRKLNFKKKQTSRSFILLVSFLLINKWFWKERRKNTYKSRQVVDENRIFLKFERLFNRLTTYNKIGNFFRQIINSKKSLFSQIAIRKMFIRTSTSFFFLPLESVFAENIFDGHHFLWIRI